MFNKDFYPTPASVIEHMLGYHDLQGKKVLEPSAGKGDIVDQLLTRGAEVQACELNDDLRKIVASKCTILNNDFLQVKAEDVSHLDFIIMNPPFSADEKHILHAIDIAPAACVIIALCNAKTLDNTYTQYRKTLISYIKEFGHSENLGDVFKDSERTTGVDIAMVTIYTPGIKADNFEGFYMDHEPEEDGTVAGLMPYDVIRDAVQRVVTAIKHFDTVYEAAGRMNGLTNTFGAGCISFKVYDKDQVYTKDAFAKEVQRKAWLWVFSKLNMQKYVTRKLKEEINYLVEVQSKIPFTVRNVYVMIYQVVTTHEQRMDKALIEISDKLTERHKENRYNHEGWKSNSSYMINKKFILPHVFERYNSYSSNKSPFLDVGGYGSNYWSELLYDLDKAIAWLTAGDMCPYDFRSVVRGGTSNALNPVTKMYEPIAKHEAKASGEWFEWGHFKIKGYFKGTAHIEFKDPKVWELVNRRIAKIMGYPLPEGRML